MIEEPYRWVDAIANRREYIDSELATGSPTIGISYDDGILLLTFGRDRRKIFEIYDRIALGGIGHPGDLERLRMMAIELASTEGFTRSTADVSLRRMANYSFSPALKQAFEQLYGAPFLARLLFAELGTTPDNDLFLRLDYDGSIHASSMPNRKAREHFGAIAGTKRSSENVEALLRSAHVTDLHSAIETAIRGWGMGLYMADKEHREVADEDQLTTFLKQRMDGYSVEAAILSRKAVRPSIAYRVVPESELESVLSKYR
jgi:proteasome alpha subunit